MLKVYEIFKSIEGEGKRVGRPSIFIRLAGCNLDCTYCDTKYANKVGTYTHNLHVAQVEDILDHVKNEYPNCKRITITGGEPLNQPDCFDLVVLLLRNGYEINIETNGSRSLKAFYENIEMYKALQQGKLIITMDWKCKSSGMQNKMCLDNLRLLGSNDVLKFVVSNTQEMRDAKGLYESSGCKATPYFSPVFNKIDAKDIVEFVKEEMPEAVVQLQMHKIIWDPEERGV